jgi:hypothetical protein
MIVALHRWLMTFVVGLSIAVLGPEAAAQQERSSLPPQERTFTHRELDSFVKAYVKAQRLRRDYEYSLRQTENPTDQEALQREAVVEFERILESEGMDVESYSRVFTVVNRDDELRQKVLQLIDEERKRS